MRITDVLVYRSRVPLRTPFSSVARGTEHTCDSVLVQVDTDEGLRGWGESAPIPSLGEETPETAEAALGGPLRTAVLNREFGGPHDLVELGDAVDRAVQGHRSAKAGLDVALHDLSAQISGMSLRARFGGAARDLETCMTIPLGDPEDMAAQARARVAQGFGILKVKLGGQEEADVRRVRAVRAAAGRSVRLWLDANQAWDVPTAIGIMRRVEDDHLDVELVEQPVRAEDVEGLASVRRNIATKVVADESVSSLETALAVIRGEAADVLSVKLQRNGGIRGALRVLSAALDAKIPCMVGCTLETQVAVTAAASALATQSVVSYVDLDAPLWLAESPVVGGVSYEGPRILLPEGPGLGIQGLAAPTLPQ